MGQANAAVDEVYRGNIERLVERGSFTRPATPVSGVRYLAPSDDPADNDWENLRGLWEGESGAATGRSPS